MSSEASCDLSIIIPTYNYGAFLRTAIDSVLEQIPVTVSVEIVVADDGSTDNTQEILAALAADDRVRPVRQENSGPAAARNLAMQNACGRYLMFLDADDSLEPGCIATTIDFMERHPEIGLFFTNYDIYDENGIVSASGVDNWKRFRGIAHEESAEGEWIFTECLTAHIIDGGAFMHTSGLTIRREVLDEIGPFETGYSYGEDDEFYARAARASRAGYVDQVLSRKRNHADSLIHESANALRNAQHILELTEIQIQYYRDDAALQSILRGKLRERAVGYCWRLIEAGQQKEARKSLAPYRAQFPLDWAFHWLWLRSLLPTRRGQQR